MESPTLGNIFTKHLGFPSRGGDALGSERFADRFADRHHAFTPHSTDPEAWVEHFFALEHPIEERVRELEGVGAGVGEGDETVLRFDLGENEFVVIDDGGEEVVVVGDRGAIVLHATPELRTRLKAAELPASSSVRPSSAFKGPGDRAFHVSGSGRTVQLDAKAVARVVASAPPVRAEPSARVAAPRQLPTLAPAVRAVAVPVPGQARSAPKAPTQAFEAMRTVARGDRGLAPAPQVVVVERSSARAVSGESARFWQRLTTALTAGGRRSENLGRTIPGASAVAIGRQTFAVKAAGVTALVQRPVQGMGTRAEAMAARTHAFERRSSSSPRWVRDVLAERPRGQGFWIPPAVATSTTGAAKPSWVDSALGHARELRQRAREELRSSTRADLGTSPAPSRRVVKGEAPELELSLPDVRVRAIPVDVDLEPGRPLVVADVMPATTLRALYTGLERTAAGEGHRIAAAAPAGLQTITSGATEAFVDVRYGAPAVRQQVREFEATPETAYVAPAYYEAPFAEGSSVRVGPDLSAAIDRAILRPVASSRSAPAPLSAAPAASAAPAPASLATLARREARAGVVEVQVVSGRVSGPTASTMPSAVSGLMGSSSAPMRLSATAWLDWAVSNAPYALAKRAGESVLQGSATSAEAIGSRREGLAREPGARSFTGVSIMEQGDLRPHSGAERPAALHALAYAEGTDVHVAPTHDHGAEHGIAHEAAHDVQPRARSLSRSSDAAAPRGLAASGTGLAIAHLGASPAPTAAATHDAFGATARPLTTSADRSILVARPVLADVNHGRAPGGEAGTVAAATGVEHVEIGVPLHVTMTESRRAPETGHALAEGAPASVTLVPQVSTSSTVDVGGQLASPGAGAARGPSAARPPSLSRPTGQFSAASSTGGAQAPGPLAATPASPTTASRAEAFAAARVAPVTTGAPESALATAVDRELVRTGPAASSGASVGIGPAAAPSRSLGVGPSGATTAFARAASTPVPAPAALRSGTGPSGGAMSSGARRKARGEGVLRFRYPAEPRWWGSAGSTTVDVGTTAATTATMLPGVRGPVHGEAPAATYVESGAMAAAPTSAPFAQGSRGAAPGLTPGAAGPSLMASPAAYGARGARSNGTRSLEGPVPAMVHASPAAPASAPESRGPGESEMAYVAVSANGEARVMGARGAARLTRQKQAGGSVDMTVVAGIAPKAPSVEELALAGHERPHAKGKKEGPAQGGAAGKTDALSLQGTVDSLAQRIYHRLKRRLASDRERFGG